MNTDSNDHDSQLDSHSFGLRVERAQHGCRQSLGILLDMCRCYLLAAANRECPKDLAGKIAPSDLVQESLLEAQRDFGQFRGTRQDELIAWLNKILRNNMYNAIRSFRLTAKREVSRETIQRKDKDVVLQVADMAPGPRSRVIAMEEAWLLEKALDRLRPAYRQAVMLRSWHQLSFSEVGQLMDRSSEASCKLWRRGIEQLKEDLKQLGKDPSKSGD